MAKQKQQTETEMAIVIPIELSPVLKDTKIEIGKAQQHAIAFAPSMQDYITLSAVINDLDKVNPSEMDAKRAREARLKMVKVRTGAEEIKDLRKEGIKAEGDLIQALYNVVKNSCIVTETEFSEIEKHQERVEVKRRSELADIRRVELDKFGADTSYLPLGIMGDEQYERCLESAKLAFEARKVAAEKAEADRLEQIRLAEDAEKERLRLQAERIEAERLEAIRVKEELAAKEAELVKEREYNAEKERLRIEAENKAKKDREVLNRRFEQMVLKEISALGFTVCDDGIENKELGWFIGSRHYDGFDTEVDAIEWFKEIKERANVMTEQVKRELATANQLAEKQKQNDRQSAMFALGLQWDGQMFHYQDINFHWTDLLCMDDDKFAKSLAGATKRMEVLKAENLKKEHELEAESLRLKKELQAKKDIEAEEAESKRLAQLAPDKDKINALYLSLKNLEIPKFESIEAATIGNYVKEQIAQLLEDIKFKSQKLK